MKRFMLSLLMLVALASPAMANRCGYCDFIPSSGIYGCRFARIPFICVGGYACSMLPFEGCNKKGTYSVGYTMAEVLAMDNLPPLMYDGAAAYSFINDRVQNGPFGEDGEIIVSLAEMEQFLLPATSYPWSTFYTFPTLLDAMVWLNNEGLVDDPELSVLLDEVEESQ